MIARRFWPLVLAFASCKRPEASPVADAGPALEPSGRATAAPSTFPPSPPRPTHVEAAEARRQRLAHLRDATNEPELAGASATLEKHFGPEQKNDAAAFDLQSAEVNVAHRHAVLATIADRPIAEARPFVVVTDEAGAVLWSKDRPNAGVLPPVTALAIAGGPSGRVALAMCDPPTKSVALRLWDEDGSPFADFQVLDGEACDGLTLMYWPHRGWVVVATAPDVTRARLLTESGSLGWGRNLDLGARSAPGMLSPASVAADTDDTFVLVQAVQPSKIEGSPFHALAFRYDAQASAIWSGATDVGVLDRPPAPGERVVVRRNQPAGVSVAIGNVEGDVLPSGTVNRQRRARP